MDTDPRRRFKVVDLMVVILAIAIVLGIVVPLLNSAREAGRRTQCQNNMRQLGLALLSFQTSKTYFPNAGTIFDDPAQHDGDPSKSNIYLSIVDPAALAKTPCPLLHSWVVDISTYLDYQSLLDWDTKSSYVTRTPTISGLPPNATLSSTPLSVLRCPDDTTADPTRGGLSYVVNGGFTRWPAMPVSWSGSAVDGASKNGAPLEWSPTGTSWKASQAVGQKLGVMFLGMHTGDQPWDVQTRPNEIIDGAAQTLFLGENLLAGESSGSSYSGGLPTNWACPLPHFCMFFGSDDVCHSPRSSVECLGGQLQRHRRDGYDVDGNGWAWANSPGSYERINYGRNLTIEGSSPFASSNHGSGANFLFCDGAVRFISEKFDGAVYAKAITPAGGQLPEDIRQLPIFLNSGSSD